MTKVSAILLAAGTSSRMEGLNKLILDYHGVPLIQHVNHEITKSIASEVIMVTSEFSNDHIQQMELGRTRVVLNDNYKEGMTSSIKKGVVECDVDTDGYMICLGDLPTLLTVDYDKLIKAFSRSYSDDKMVIIMPSYKGSAGNPIIFSSTYQKAILQHDDMSGCKGIVQANADHVHQERMSSNSIHLDIDTRGDYRTFM